MKTAILLVLLFVFSTRAFAGEPTPSVLSAFQKTFPQTGDVKWFAEAEGYSAYFIQDGITHRINYDAKGNILSGIRYYKEAQLPFVIKAKIKKKFDNKTVYGVAEITVDDETVYRIFLQDQTSLMTVHSDAFGNLSVVASYKRLVDHQDLANN